MPPPSSPPFPQQYYAWDDAVVAFTLHEPDMALHEVPEALIQDLWQTQRFDQHALTTTDGQPIEVVQPGRHNTDAGPDFLDAHVRIADVSWRGDIEIHTHSRLWQDHQHHRDARYNSVILHVTLLSDLWTGRLLREDSSPLSELVLYPRLGHSLRSLLHAYLTRAQQDLLCADYWPQVPRAVRRPWLHHLARERLRAKRDQLASAFLTTPSLDQLLYQGLFAGLGYAKNDAAMTLLAERVPMARLQAHADARDREALLFGAAGLLPHPGDLLEADRATADYAMDLRIRFERMQRWQPVPVMDRTQWRYFRLRPANFPPLRIAQAATLFAPNQLLHHAPIDTLVAALADPEPAQALRAALRVSPAPFWQHHVRLEKPSRPHDPTLGVGRIDALLVNTVLPLLLLAAEQRGHPAPEEALLVVAEQLGAPNDEVTRRFKRLGTPPRNAFQAQGLHQLYRTRCTTGGCLRCPIGRYMLGPAERMEP